MEQTLALSCDGCGFSYQSFELLADHLRNLLSDRYHQQQTYVCTCNSNLLYNIQQYIAHLSLEHDATNQQSSSVQNVGRRKYICPECSREFADKSNMKKHRKLHSGDKPHECNICKHSFAKRSNLTQHLAMHQRSSTDVFKCAVCEKEYFSKSALKLHFRVHTNESPFKCKKLECDLAFRTRKLLNSHVNRTHSSVVGSNQRSYSPHSAQKVVRQIAELSGTKISEDPPLKASATSAFQRVSSGSNTSAAPRNRLQRRASETVAPTSQMIRFNSSVDI
ncbi:unnamed protein product [Bursaphelenchus xylophilus]|uniref:(pine wood nematode) hypothetical protein n=1 Tax=Bursaphelenchus xylophilus TaxID=6326 RepID=A0A1I7S944_BURXY|nr:unnamed protein product [Bursaphelenchus xylophilus]CAG9086244.1 unnamed protein product [Bursaphelenchus xylophilus]